MYIYNTYSKKIFLKSEMDVSEKDQVHKYGSNSYIV